jgi:UDP-glucose 4-epimerase
VGLRFVEKNPQNVFPLLARAATTGAPFGIFGDDYATHDGTCVRDYIHLHDLVDAHIRALSVDVSSTLNLGTETGVSVRELVNAFATATGTSLTTDIRPRRAGDPAIVVASSARAREVLGWQPTQTLHDMVRSTLDTYTH